MAWLLQPECNFLHGHFRCKLPVEVVDVEVKVTSMQGTHIFRRDQTTQLVRCIPWTPNLCPHPNMIKKMKTFLEVQNKMGPIIPALASQFRLPLPESNPNVRKSDASEKRKRVTPKKRFRPATPRATATCLPLPQVPPKSTNDAATTPAPAMVREDTPWPSAGKMSGNLFQDRNWLLLKGYLAMKGEKEGVVKPYPKEEDKKREQDPNQKEEKCAWGPDCPFCKAQEEEADLPHQQRQMEDQQQKPLPKLQVKRPDTLNMTKTKQQWEQEMERLNDKYNLDCFSNSELDSESDEDEQYQYQHGYETLI